MPSKQSGSQKATVERVMHEFKEGELETQGRKVKNPRQAIAIALSEAGASNRDTAAKNKRNLSHTKAKEARGETAEAEKEGKAAQDRTLAKGARGGAEPARSASGKSSSGKPAPKSQPKAATQAKSASASGYRTREQLYAEARRKDVPGRSKMNRDQLAHALGH